MDNEEVYAAQNREVVLNQLLNQIVLTDETQERLRAMSSEEFKIYISLTPHVFKHTEITRKKLEALYAYKSARTSEEKVEALKAELDACGPSGKAFSGLTPGTPEYSEKQLVSLEDSWLVKFGRLELSVS